MYTKTKQLTLHKYKTKKDCLRDRECPLEIPANHFFIEVDTKGILLLKFCFFLGEGEGLYT